MKKSIRLPIVRPIVIDHSLSAEVLRQGRKQRGMTQRDMAAVLEMEPGTFSQVESGRRRFPIQRLSMLPEELALEMREALITEFAVELDEHIRSGPQTEPRAWPPSKGLAAAEPAA